MYTVQTDDHPSYYNQSYCTGAGTPRVDPNARTYCSMSYVSSFSTVSVLMFVYHPCEGAVCLKAPAHMDWVCYT